MIEPTLATTALIFLRSIQVQNVIGKHYIAASLTPFAIAAAEVAVMLQVIEHTWSAVPWIGLGGAIGVTMAMSLHQKIRGLFK